MTVLQRLRGGSWNGGEEKYIKAPPGFKLSSIHVRE